MKKIITKVVALALALVLVCGIFSGNSIDSYALDGDVAITVDGDFSDWLYITPLYMGGGQIPKLSAFVTEEFVYGKMEVSNPSDFDTWHIYFETNGNNTDSLLGNGAEYVLETDILYKYEGTDGEWESLQGTTAQVIDATSSDKSVLEFAVPIDAFDGAEKIGIHAAKVHDWVDVAMIPEEANGYYDIPALEDVLSEEIVGLTENELAAFEASKEFLGVKSQWDAIDYDAVFKNSNLTKLRGFSDGEFLYINVSGKRFDSNYTVYVKTNTNAGTDKSDIWENGENIRYQVKANGTVYKMEGNKKVDLGTPCEDFYTDKTGMEIKIPVEVLTEDDKPSEFYISVEADGEFLPDLGRDMLKITSPRLEDAPKITIDGNPSDWEGVEPIGEGEGSLGNLYAIRDNENLYVMTYIEDVTNPESSAAYTTSLFIGIDNDPRTGFNHTGYAHDNTGDVLVQDWNSYGENRNLELFFTSELVNLEWNMKKQYADGYEKVFAPTGVSGEYCAEYIVPISALEEFATAISDDFYVCIDRNDCQTDEETYERLTPEGFTPKRDTENGGFALVPKYNTKCSVDCKDNSFDDWERVGNFARHENNLNLSGVLSEDRLFTIFTAEEDISTDAVYVIKTNEPGFKYGNYEGISYVVERGTLYKVEGDNKKAEEGVSVYQYYDTDCILMQLYLDMIDNPSSVSVAIMVNGDEYVLPETGLLTISKKVEIERDENLFYPRESFEVFNNPFKGWVGWADINEGDIDNIATPHNLIYVDIKWSELEKEKGKYDFDAIEEQYQFDKWKARGDRMVLRFVMDNPNVENGDPNIKRMDIPTWLYDELEEENAEGEGAGTFYVGQTILDLLGGCGFSPNYKSPKLLEYHSNVVKALAERYDDPSVCAYVEVGSLGHWAEFHTWPTGTGEFPDPALAQQYMQPYADYFKNVKVGIRKPYELASVNNWGLYNDIFGVTSDGGTPTFLEWANSGNTDMPGSTEEDIEASKMPEWWKLNFSGGEFANGDFRTNALTENVVDVLKQIRDSHTTWLGPCSACDFKVGDDTYEDFRYNIETFFKTMGYRYNLASITKITEALRGEEIPVKMVWNNAGVAPIYYDCDVTLFIKDSEGKVVYEGSVDTDTTTWLPGKSSVESTIAIPDSLNNGEYTLFVSMKTSDSNAQTISLAMADKDEEGLYKLYSFNVVDEKTVVSETDAESAQITENKDAKKSNVALIATISAVAVLAIVAAVFVILKKKGSKK